MTNACKWIAPMVTLVDGTRVPSDSEEWRAECEARHILNQPHIDARHEILYGPFNIKSGKREGGLMKHRGADGVKAIESKIMELWNARRSARAVA